MADKQKEQHFLKTNIDYFLKWLVLSTAIGVVGGIIGGVFSRVIAYATNYYQTNSYMMYFLPIAGLITVFLYIKNHEYVNAGTNMVILAIREKEPIHKRHGILIFFSTLLSHFTGASVGKEGAALQIGGSLGSFFGEKFHLQESDQKIMMMAGMSALFGSVFGTPIGAAVFPIEMISVGVMYYAALFPCLLASIWGSYFAHLIHAPVDIFEITGIVNVIDQKVVVDVALIGVLCALLSIGFTYAIHRTEMLYSKYIRNPYYRILTGALLFMCLVLIFGNDYCGSGSILIDRALYESVPPYAFILKILFSVVALGAGFKGGEIVPTLTIGCTFGYFLGPLVGLDPHFTASLAMIGLFAGMTNCPIASCFMAIEMFGGQGTAYYGMVVCLSYALSGYMGLYRAQKFMYSKTDNLYINYKDEDELL